MDAAGALADLLELSTHVEAAVLVTPPETLLASTLDDDERSREVARLAGGLLAAADTVRPAGHLLTQLEVAMLTGSVFVVRDGERAIVATTVPEPTVGLVLYDLESCLRAVAGNDPAQPVAEAEAAP